MTATITKLSSLMIQYYFSCCHHLWTVHEWELHLFLQPLHCCHWRVQAADLPLWHQHLPGKDYNLYWMKHCVFTLKFIFSSVLTSTPLSSKALPLTLPQLVLPDTTSLSPAVAGPSPTTASVTLIPLLWPALVVLLPQSSVVPILPSTVRMPEL